MTHMILKTNRYAKENTDQMMYGYAKFCVIHADL